MTDGDWLGTYRDYSVLRWLNWLTLTDGDWQTLTVTYSDWRWLTLTDTDWQGLTVTYGCWEWLTVTYSDCHWVAVTDGDLRLLTVTDGDWQWLTLSDSDWQWLRMAYSDWGTPSEIKTVLCGKNSPPLPQYGNFSTNYRFFSEDVPKWKEKLKNSKLCFSISGWFWHAKKLGKQT